MGRHNTDPVGWSEEEDKKLLAAAALLPKGKQGERLKRGAKDALGVEFPERSLSSVVCRYKLLKQRISAGKDWRVTWRMKNWTSEDEAKLRALYATGRFHMGLKKAFPDRSYASVRQRAEILGLGRRFTPIVPFHLSSEDRAFAAGMINGDGSVGTYRNNKRPDAWDDYVSFSNTEKEMVDWFAERIPTGYFSKREVDYNREAMKQFGIKTRKASWFWTLKNKAMVCYFLEMIYPYLLGHKKKNAEAILKRLTPLVAKEIADSYPLPDVNAA